ncbi:sugar ABC transporter ATP-binding protein [Microbispora sp. NPDC046933]|uniref:sugar ABC transporter ATP-binding protein n=1 Tax=Microbispora sp. NPDC046933 TaxID=3155618 RepID=UPI0033CE11C8
MGTRLLMSALTITGLTKRFAGTTALDRAALSVRPGTVHALLGGNGSGKSTMIKILAGVHRADAGQITVMGRTYEASQFTAAHARQAGLRFVHQDLGLFDELSVAENFALDAGYPTAAGRRVRWSALHRRVSQVLETYEIDVDPRTPIHRLRPADQTMVAIARALRNQEEGELILVLDEPTARLGEHESALLLDAVRRRAAHGQTVLLVSHRLQEVLRSCDDFTVLVDGTVGGALVDAHPTERDLIRLMAGGTEPDLGGHAPRETSGPAALRIEGLRAGPLRGVELTVGEGEIVGVAGLVGSGRTTLLKTLFGARRAAGGRMWLHGEPYAPRTPAEAIRAGVALVPEDRGGEAAFADLPIRDNLAVTVLRRYWRATGMPRSRERRDSAALMTRYAVKAAGPDAVFSSMSGGNQQKAVLARWLRREPRLLLLDEPTQGVDVVSRADIYAAIRAAVADGCSVLVTSSDLVELETLCDRVVLLKSGRTAGEVIGPHLTAAHLTGLVQSALGANP